jgi:RNA polymerase sigma factor (sigma-70 family)
MSGPRAPLPRTTFGDFFRDAYQPLVRDVIFAGATPDEAEDAVSAAMVEVLRRWDAITNPRAYARRAAINNMIKNRQRGLRRIVERGDVPPEGELDPGLLVWEQQEWVTLLLKSLAPAQRQVLACMVDMFTPQEIARLLGKTEAAVRQSLRAARQRLAACLGEPDATTEEAR